MSGEQKMASQTNSRVVRIVPLLIVVCFFGIKTHAKDAWTSQNVPQDHFLVLCEGR